MSKPTSELFSLAETGLNSVNFHGIDRVVLSRKKGSKLPEGTLIVDRRSPYGNPYKMSKHETRSKVVKKFATWWWRDAQKELRVQLLIDIREKNIKHLGCWCGKKEICHADILLEYLNI